MTITSLTDIRRAFEREFQPNVEKFDYFVLASDDWRNHDLIRAARPGVYVWWDGAHNRVMKVGMSSINARARALQHLLHNTGDKMAALADQPHTRMILFTLEESDKHLAADLEIYLERVLEPEIPSG